jgi:hypothetical protein
LGMCQGMELFLPIPLFSSTAEIISNILIFLKIKNKSILIGDVFFDVVSKHTTKLGAIVIYYLF